MNTQKFEDELQVGSIICLVKNYNDTKHSFGLVTEVSSDTVRMCALEQKNYDHNQRLWTSKSVPIIPSEQETAGLIAAKQGSVIPRFGNTVKVSEITSGGVWRGNPVENTHYG